MPNYSIDTRTLKPGDIYIPIKGPRFDGHDFIEEAKKKGASQILDVDLGQFAKSHRQKFSIPVIGITGSSGKTTVKDMLTAVLKEKFKNVVSSYENQNNEVGVPLTLLKINEESQAAVIEMAMRARGEIKYLAELTAPTHVGITSLGTAHLERLGSREEIARAKAEIFYPGCKVFINHALPFQKILIETAQSQKCQIVFFEEKDLLKQNEMLVTAIAKDLGLNDKQIEAGVSHIKRSSHRMAVLNLKNNITVIDDAYNANPDSMHYAVQILKSMSAKHKGRKILIAGDMLELGDQAADLHAGLDLADIDCVLTLGMLSKNMTSGKKVLHFDERDVLWETLRTELQAGDQILVKGSRGMKMEWFVEKLKEQLAND